MITERHILICAFLLLLPYSHSKVKLPPFFADHMVLQQKATVKLYGETSPNTDITLTTSWDNKESKTRSDQTGRWEVLLQTPTAGGPYTIRINDGDLTTLSDILIGEVWLCSGQSNMEMPMKGFKGQPVYGSQPVIASANPNTNIRMLTVKKNHSSVLTDTIRCEGWLLNTPETVSRFSAVGYFFGSSLHESLQVPIGLVQSAWSGSNIEAWIDRETLETVPGIKFTSIPDAENKSPNKTPTLLYNTMIHPICDISFSGVIWYQGEGNRNRPGSYELLFEKLINKWRITFGNQELPFYYVQLAPTALQNKDDFDFPRIQEIQLRCMQKIPHTGMAFTNDVGDERNIHAPNKRPIGERLAYWALANTYQKKGIIYSGPVVKSIDITEKGIELDFEHAPMGLVPENEPVKGFEVLKSNGEIAPVKAQIVKGTSKVKLHIEDELSSITEIRYCYRNYLPGNLFNTAYLPASPFRMALDNKN